MRKHFLIGAAIFCVISPQAAIAQASPTAIETAIETYLQKNPAVVEQIVKNYLITNPQVMQEVLAAMIKGKTPPLPDRTAVIQSNAEALFASKHQVNLGPSDGDVTLVEFFDYNCGFCKRALADKLSLLATDKRLKVVLKEFPVLGQGSLEAAKVAIAARMQDKDGKRYMTFHEGLLRSPRADLARALIAAKEAGFDLDIIQRDMASEEVDNTLAETRRLATELGINGTPSYVVGKDVVVGAVGLQALTEKIRAARL